MTLRIQLAILGAFLALASPVRAELEPEPLYTNTELAAPSEHWVLYLDINLTSFNESRYILLDADTLQVKAFIGTGQLPAAQYSPDGTR